MMDLDAILWATLHFAHADRANAAIHTSRVKYSPLTFRLAKVLLDADPTYADDMTIAAVAADFDSYPLDMGR